MSNISPPLLRRRMMMMPGKYLRFIDPDVGRICKANFSSDGIGVTRDDAANVTESDAIKNAFGNTKTITSFNELSYFTGLTFLVDQTFASFKQLTSVSLPASLTEMGIMIFAYDSALTEVTYNSPTFHLHRNVFYQCESMSKIHVPSVETYLGYTHEAHNTASDSPFMNSTAATRGLYVNGSLITTIEFPNSITSVPGYVFDNFNTITEVTIPASVTSIGIRAFNNCSALKNVKVLAMTIPTLASDVFRGNASGRKIYVPHGMGNAYKAASGWSAYASDIEELDENGNIPT